MRLLILTTSFPRFPGDPPGNFILHQIRGIRKRDNHITVLAPHAKNLKKSESIESINVERFIYNLPFLENVAYGSGIHENIKSSIIVKLNMPLFLISFFIRGLVLSRKADIIHAHWLLPSGLVGLLSKKFLKKPFVVTLHGTDLREAVEKKYIRPIARIILQNTDAIILVNSYQRNMLKKIGIKNKNIFVIHNGVEELEKLLKNEIKNKFGSQFIFIARLVPIKNLHLVLDSLLILKTRSIKFNFTVVGTGPDMDQSKRFVLENNLTREVKFLGAKDKSVVLRMLPNYDLFILPQGGEGAGIALLEAMAAGVPSISGRIPGIDEMIKEGETGFTTSTSNPQELANLIEKITSRNRLLHKVALNAREKVRGMSWINQNPKLEGVYNLLVKR